jgi:hypothetical protein
MIHSLVGLLGTDKLETSSGSGRHPVYFGFSIKALSPIGPRYDGLGLWAPLRICVPLRHLRFHADRALPTHRSDEGPPSPRPALRCFRGFLRRLLCVEQPKAQSPHPRGRAAHRAGPHGSHSHSARARRRVNGLEARSPVRPRGFTERPEVKPPGRSVISIKTSALSAAPREP